MAPATDQLTAPPAAPSLPPGYDPNTGTVPAASQGTAPAPSPAATPATMEATPPPRNYERVWDAIKEGIPAFNNKFEAAAHTDTGKLATGETPEMQLVTPQAAMTPKEQAEHPILTETGKVAGGFTSPGNMMLLAGTSGLGSIAETAPWAIKLIPKLAQAGFTAQALDAAYDRLPDLKKAWDAGDEKGVEAALTDSVLNTAAGIAAGAYPEKTGEGGKVGAIQPLEQGALPEGKVLDVEGRVVDEGKPHPIAEPTLPKGETPAEEQPAGKLDDLGTRLPDLQTAEQADRRDPQTRLFPSGNATGVGRIANITHDILRQHAAEAKANAPTIEHRENVATFGSGSEAPQEMSQVRLKQGDKTVGRLNYVIDPATKTASVKGITIEDPKLQGKGYAQQMYLAAADKARAAGATALTSDLQGTTSMDAARVWDKLAAKGHPVEKIPSKPGSPGYVMDLTKPSPLPQYGQALSERGELPGQTVQLGDLGAKYVGKAPSQITTSEIEPKAASYHPDLQKMADKYGVVPSPSGGTEASFITPDGKFIRLPAGGTHDTAIDFVTGRQAGPEGDNRIGFLNDTGAIRLRVSNDKAGKTAHISIPAGGVTEEQIPAVQQAIAAAGRNGNVVMERADVTPETQDQLTMSKDFPRPSDAADYLRQIQAHPDQHADLQTPQLPLKHYDPEVLLERARQNLPKGSVHSITDPYAFKTGDHLAWISPDGKTSVDLTEDRDHAGMAHEMMTDTDYRGEADKKMLQDGWVRKNGSNDFEVAKLTPVAIETIEKAAIADKGFGKEVRIDVLNPNFISGAAGEGHNTRVNTVTIPDGWENLAKEIHKLRPDQHEPEDLQTNEHQSPLKEPYAIEITGKDGATRTESVDAFSSKDALKTAQKKFPDATEWSLHPDWSSARRDERDAPSTEYVVPTGKLASMPVQEGREPIQTIYHELGHAMIGEKEGLTQKGMLRHTHPDVGGNRAGVLWSGADLFTPARTLKPQKLEAVVNNMMGGIAADEIFNDLHRAANWNFDISRRGGDGNQAYRFLRDAGYTHDQALERMHKAIDQNKDYLTKPEVSGVIKENAGVREPGLSTQYHYSPERLKNMHLEAQRRIANGTNTEGTDNGTAGGGSTQNHPAVVARGEGGVSETAGQEAENAPEAAPEVTPQQQVIAEMSKLGDPDKAQMQLAERAGRVRIKALETAPGARQQGHAAALLSKLTDSADKHGVTLELTASPYAPVGFTDKILDSDELQAFYKRHGFVMEPGHDPAYGYMIREPKSPETAPEVKNLARVQQAIDIANKPNLGTSRDYYRGAGSLKGYDWPSTPVEIQPDDPRVKPDALGSVNPRRVNAYKKEYQKGSDFPPVVITEHPVTGDFIPQDGAHRLQAARELGVPIKAFIGRKAPEVNPHDLVERAQQALAAGDKKTAADLLAQARAALQSSELTTAEVKKPSEPWAETAGKAMAENGAFTINPRTGEIPNTGHWLEAGPELRQVSDKPSTPAEIQKFAAQPAVKKMLAKYPELQIGGYKNDAGKYELNLSASSADPEAARAVATKLDQESTWDAGGQKLNPAGGKNQKTSFPDYPMDERLRDLAPKEPGQTISTRYPSAVAATEDPLRHGLALSGENTLSDPKMVEKYANEVKDYPGFTPPEGADAKGTVNAFINHVKDNLEWLYKQSTPAEQEANGGWYDGAHQLTKDLADKHGYTHMQTAGVTAALSPQKDWDMNVSLAKRLTDIVKNHADEKASPEMIQTGKDIVAQTQEVNPEANAALQKMFNKIKGKSLDELIDPTQRAAWVRLYDEANNPREVEKIGPDGKPQGLRTNLDGSPTRVTWGSLNTINKALSILKDGSRENISRTLGGAHKVRSFYNNIIDPDSTRGDVTIDTHAVAAGLLRPLGGFDSEVIHNFKSPNSAVAGLKGTYPRYHAAYTEAAKDLDIPYPRMLQSVVWEKIRNIFPAEFKTAKNNDAINAIWKEHEDGSITADQARTRILDYAKSHAPVSEGQRAGIDKGELPLRGVHGESAEGYERSGVSAGNPVEDDTSFNFGANAPEELPPTPQPKPKKMKGAVSAMSLLSGLKKAGSKPK